MNNSRIFLIIDKLFKLLIFQFSEHYNQPEKHG